MKKYLLLILLLCSSAVLLSCSSQTLDDYSGTQPALDLKRFFDGQLRAYGMLQNRSGEMTRRFTATINASWQGDTGLLEEAFNFDDGEVQYRTWHLTDHGNGRYTGSAEDVVGEAAGSIVGSVFQWQYLLEVPYRDNAITVALDDWLYLIDDDHLINKTELTKFGFKVGELTLLIEKL